MHRTLTIRGARVHNLAGLDLDVPHGRLVVFAGVSGSGKSSLVFDTIAAEAGYQLNETFPPFARNRLPKWSRPEVDHIDGLTPVVVVDQRRLGGNARSTLGTVTDAWTYLRLLYSRLSEPHVGESNRFSFNDPAGLCPTCAGLGEVVVSAVERFLDPDRSLAGGAIRLPGFQPGQYWYRQYAELDVFDPDVPLRDWPASRRDALLHGGAGLPPDFQGVVDRFERVHLHTSDDLSERKQDTIRRFTRAGRCPDCGGSRLNEAARTATVHGHPITELSTMEITELAALVPELGEPRVAPVVSALRSRLEALVTIGLGYLSLSRPTATLSGGESQRVKLVRHLGSSLTGMTYVIDEPTVGLHATDVVSVVRLLERLRDAGNTVLVVEHDPSVMARADQIVEIGPAAGTGGGRLVFQGGFGELQHAGTATARALSDRQPGARHRTRHPTGHLTVAHASRNNLRDITVRIPTGVLTVLTGVAGSGKSSLAAELAAQHPVTAIDQRAVGTSRRSTPVTYTGIAPAIRALFAARSHEPAGLFSPNSTGGCPSCQGLGVIHTDLAFLDGHEITCDTCQGSRFTLEALSHTVDGLTIADVDALTVDEAATRLPAASISEALRHLSAVGLGYLRLGQALNTLSGGECQRLKIAKELHTTSGPTTYLLDEPTTALHPTDIATLLTVLDALLDRGHTVIVIEHDLDVIRHADHLVDLGPGPGRHGGTLLYEGPITGYTDPTTPTGSVLNHAAARTPG